MHHLLNASDLLFQLVLLKKWPQQRQLVELISVPSLDLFYCLVQSMYDYWCSILLYLIVSLTEKNEPRKLTEILAQCLCQQSNSLSIKIHKGLFYRNYSNELSLVCLICCRKSS